MDTYQTVLDETGSPTVVTYRDGVKWKTVGYNNLLEFEIDGVVEESQLFPYQGRLVTRDLRDVELDIYPNAKIRITYASFGTSEYRRDLQIFERHVTIRKLQLLIAE